MDDKKKYELFEGKTLSNIFEDIYNNSSNTKKQVTNLVDKIKPYITNIETAIIVVPLIKEYLEIGVRNDEHLVKLADTVQRLLRNDQSNSDGNDILPEEEKKKLLEEYQEILSEKNKDEKVVDNINKKVDNIKDELESKQKL